MHDKHLIEQVNAYAVNDYAKAQQMQLEGYQQMLGVANTLVGAIQKTVKPGLPVGGSKTGGGGQPAATMTRSRRGLAVGVAALALLAGCASSGAHLADPSTAVASQTPDRTASPQTPDPAPSGLDAARSFRSPRGYRATPSPSGSRSQRSAWPAPGPARPGTGRHGPGAGPGPVGGARLV